MASKKREEIQLENLCRTCLAKEIELFSVFDVYLEGKALDHIITSITGLKIDKGDGLPKKICQECKGKAINAYDFKRKSHEADLALHGILKKEETKDASFSSESMCVDVKVEDYISDNNDELIDLEYDLALPDGSSNEFNEIVKMETRAKETNQFKNCSTDNEQSEQLPDQMKKECIKVEYELTSSTFCPLCGVSYVDSDGLTKHMWECHAEVMGPKKRGRPKKMVTDTILSKLSENGYYLKTVPMKRLNCTFCKAKFKTKEELVTHVPVHKGTKVLCCIICKKMYLEKKSFDSHLCAEEKRTKLDEIQTSIAATNNTEQDDFMIETFLHQLVDLSINPEGAASWQSCEACGALLAGPAELAEHVDELHPELSLRCALCNKVFASVKSASRHRGRCARVERAHACVTCGRRFAHAITLNKHILKQHAGQSVSVRFADGDGGGGGGDGDGERCQCDTCGRRFRRKDLLAKHTKNHKPSDKYFECDICKKRFHRSDNLRSHMRVHGAGASNSAGACLCLYCGRSFTNSSNLIVHMRRHTGEKPYKCDFCDKGFPRSSDLQCHRRSHTGEKPYICGVCGKGFSRSNKLSRHMRVHTGLRPYKCPYCEKAFSQSNDLNLHVRRHTGDKPYICELCGDRFIQGTALHNHRRTHGHYVGGVAVGGAAGGGAGAPLPAPPPAQLPQRSRR